MALLPYARTLGDTTLPFWHRIEPQLAAFHLDPSYQRLKASFPDTWQNLVRIKSYVDALALADTNEGFDEEQRTAYAQTLTARVAAEFGAIAAAESSADGRPGVAAAAFEAARVFSVHAEFGRWSDHVVHKPVPGEPWLYCGPLSTWRARTTTSPVSLLVADEDLANQVHIDNVDAEFDTVTEVVAGIHGTQPFFIEARPAMCTLELLLCGGEMSFGHKNFAHFLPLEAPGGSVKDDDFTVVFTNVHRARLEACSAPLLQRALGEEGTQLQISSERLLAASLTWFRCHDFGHFWRASENAGKTWTGLNGLTPFESMALEETYADTLGLLCAARIHDGEDLSAAYNTELMRYLSRDCRMFADTVAATVGIGWLAEEGIELPASSSVWLDKGSESLAELARTIHRVLWGDEPAGEEVTRLAEAFAKGRAVTESHEVLFDAMPSDVVFVQG
ncbi:hypothetical protein [Streptomyces sp. NPDC001165]|uniref:hypothetical protein n=1 Tax=Streptomyces sp. NPDC001165 TaxID=3364546 RepID=UPI003696CA75